MQHKPIQFYKSAASQGAAAAGSPEKDKNTKGKDVGNGVDASLPEIGHKFSSWSKEDQNLNELDELLAEHDLMAENAGGKHSKSGISATIHVTRANGTSSPDNFDFEEVMDEFGDGIEAGGADLTQKRAGDGIDQEASNSFDLDNSDDLNRFIQKYETMLDGDQNKKSNSKLSANADLAIVKQNSGSRLNSKTLNRDKSKDLEESWGSLQEQAERMLGVPGDIEDETDSERKAGVNTSVSTVSAAAQHKIEEEIIAEEIRLA